VLLEPDVVDLIEVFDELRDQAAIQSVQEGRKALKAGSEGVPVSRLFHQIKESRK